MDLYNTYSYDGPVMEFGKCIADRWKGVTKAPTEGKARANLMYQFKYFTGRRPTTKISLPGEIKILN